MQTWTIKAELMNRSITTIKVKAATLYAALATTCREGRIGKILEVRQGRQVVLS